MPELPDLEIYIAALRRYVVDRRLESIRLKSPFLLRSVTPRVSDIVNRRVITVERLGKRIVIGLEFDHFLVLHLMVAGRLQWAKRGAGIPGRWGQAAFDFESGTLMLTEAGSKKRASLYLVSGRESLELHDPGGIEVLESELGEFAESLLREKHTLKRALTDPRLFSGIGNAYSDEILHAARLSPLQRTDHLTEEEVARLFEASRQTLTVWTERVREETGAGFPRKVTAFREGMAVHGRYREPCPVCGEPVQRIVYAENESNYCAQCQTGGRLLADRALSRLLRDDWPRNLDELEQLRRRGSRCRR